MKTKQRGSTLTVLLSFRRCDDADSSGAEVFIRKSSSLRRLSGASHTSTGGQCMVAPEMICLSSVSVGVHLTQNHVDP